jgi:hypothetical protein
MGVPNFNSTPTKEWRDHLLLTLFGMGLLGAIITLMLPLYYPYSNDTPGYLQEALNWLDGKGLLRGTAWHETQEDLAAFPLFPPGYPLEIAALSKLGLNLPHAALAASWLAWLLLLPAIAYAVRPLAGRWAAMAIAVLAASSPGLVEWGYLALSDTGMTLFSVLSLGILLRQDLGEGGNWRAIMLSGLLAGWAYVLRNAAAVLPLTVIAFLTLSLLTKRLGWQATFRIGLLWGAGFAALAFPLFFYNLNTFGSIQPYFAAHGGTDFGVLRSFRLSLWSFLLDVSSWRAVANIAWSAVAMVLLFLPAGLLLLWTGWQRWRQSSQMAQSALMLLLLYTGIGFAVIVWGRSHFDWVETTLTRQLMPYSWVALTAALWVVRPHPNHEQKALSSVALLLLIGLVLLGGRINVFWTNLQREVAIQEAVKTYGFVAASARMPGVVLTNRIKINTSRDRVLIELLKNLPANAHIVSNHGPLLSMATGRHIRSFDPTAENFSALADIRLKLIGRPVVLAMIPTNAILRSARADTWQNDMLLKLSGRHETLIRTPTVLVVSLP